MTKKTTIWAGTIHMGFQQQNRATEEVEVDIKEDINWAINGADQFEFTVDSFDSTFAFKPILGASSIDIIVNENIAPSCVNYITTTSLSPTLDPPSLPEPIDYYKPPAPTPAVDITAAVTPAAEVTTTTKASGDIEKAEAIVTSSNLETTSTTTDEDVKTDEYSVPPPTTSSIKDGSLPTEIKNVCKGCAEPCFN
ncbi:hypothetical protein BGZ49_008494 [Haplosporangium sp. Z 27]|nr:hypothetical protein BGZ49_008494 [Haplosporangium sp. Z 27]